jgi:hypothetical protein
MQHFSNSPNMPHKGIVRYHRDHLATTSAHFASRNFALNQALRANTLMTVNDLITPKSWLEHQILHSWIAIIAASASIGSRSHVFITIVMPYSSRVTGDNQTSGSYPCG